MNRKRTIQARSRQNITACRLMMDRPRILGLLILCVLKTTLPPMTCGCPDRPIPGFFMRGTNNNDTYSIDINNY